MQIVIDIPEEDYQNLKTKDIPFYYKPSIKAVMDTIALSSSDNLNKWIPVKWHEITNEERECEDCCNGNQEGKAKLCQKSYLAGMEAKQRTGRWIPDICNMYICSECNRTYTDLSGKRNGMNFCPNCGCRMFESQESEE